MAKTTYTIILDMWQKECVLCALRTKEYELKANNQEAAAKYRQTYNEISKQLKEQAL